MPARVFAYFRQNGERNLNNSQNSANNVRHSYPIAIRDDSIKTAFGLLLQTLPYALIRSEFSWR